MELKGISCSGCGSTDVVFDPVTRKLHCNQCGKEEFYSRAALGSNEKVSIVADNAVKAFTAGNRQAARRFAGDVLNIMIDDLPALFILAYLDEFQESRNGAVRDFFTRAQTIRDVQGDEIRELILLFEAALYNMRDYEAEMLTLVVENMQAQADRPELTQFIEKVSPYCIGKYPSSDFMTEERCSLYCDIAANCSVPRTCFALLKGIESNPDSPYVTGTFYMQARTQSFYDNYVVRVGRVIDAMTDNGLHQKFEAAYNECVQKYRDRAQEGKG